MPIDHPSFGRLDDDRVIVFDTTLRDGEQSPGFSMNLEPKSSASPTPLAELGADVIEAGFPIASHGRFRQRRGHIARDVRGPVICGLARSAPADILRAAEAVKPCGAPAHPHLHQHQPAAHEIQAPHGAGRRAGSRHRVCHAGPQPHRGRRMVRGGRQPHRARISSPAAPQAAIAAGATTINIPDTVGYALPEDLTRIFTDAAPPACRGPTA